MLRLALQTLRFRRAGFAASFIALALGALIVMVCGGLLETGVRNTLPPHRFAATPIVVAANPTAFERARLDSSLTGTLASVPGVAKAVPDVSFPAALISAGRRLGPPATGHGWSSASLGAFTLSSGQSPAGDEVVVDDALAAGADVRPGDAVQVVAAGSAASYRISGVAHTGTPTIYFPDATAARLGIPGKADAIGVFPASGADVNALRARVARAVAGEHLTVLTGDRRGVAEYDGSGQGSETLIVLAGVFGGMAIMVVIMVVASTLGLSVQQRRRELALLRAIGTTPRQLRRMVLGEALVVGVAATAVAGLAGPALGSWLLRQLAAHDAVPSAMEFHEGWIPRLSAAGIVLLVAIAAAFVAGRRAARVRPVEALLDASLQQRWVSPIRLLLAVLFLGGGLALALVTTLVMHGPLAASTAGPSAMCWAFGLALLSPGLCRVLLAVLQWPVRFGSRVAGFLAALDARSRRVRVAAAVTPIMLALGLAVGMGYLQTTQAADASREFLRPLHPGVVLTSDVGGLPASLLDRVRDAPHAGGVTALVTSNGYLQDAHGRRAEDDTPLLGISGGSAGSSISYPVATGSLVDLHGDTVALSVASAHRIHRTVGDTVTVWLGDGSAMRLRVVALVAFHPGYGSVLLPADLLAAHTTSGLTQQILVRGTPGTDPAALRASLAAATRPYSGVRIEPGDALRQASVQQERTGMWVNLLIIGMIVGYATIALVNSLALGTAERRREFALQRLIGATRGQILRTAAAESMLITLAGVLLGTVVAAATLAPFAMALHGSLDISGPAWVFVAAVGAAGALTLGTVLVTTGAALRRTPVHSVAE